MGQSYMVKITVFMPPLRVQLSMNFLLFSNMELCSLKIYLNLFYIMVSLRRHN